MPLPELFADENVYLYENDAIGCNPDPNDQSPPIFADIYHQIAQYDMT
jgi:hypothetical protein